EAAENAVISVAQHLSLLLRAEKIRQRSFVRKYSDFDQLRYYLYHKLRRFADAVDHLKKASIIFPSSSNASGLRAHIDELEAVCRRVERSRKQEDLLRYLCATRGDRVPFVLLPKMLQQFVESPCYMSPVVVKLAKSVQASISPITRDRVLALFLLI